MRKELLLLALAGLSISPVMAQDEDESARTEEMEMAAPADDATEESEESAGNSEDADSDDSARSLKQLEELLEAAK